MVSEWFVRYHSKCGVPALLNFLDAPSAIITIGGSLSAVLCSNKLSGFIAGIKSFALPFKEKSVDPGETINKIIELSNVSRKEGLLALGGSCRQYRR